MSTTTADRPLGVREGDPAGAQFESFTYQSGLPHGDWSYIMDDWGLAYDRQRLWPFRWDDMSKERDDVAAVARRCRKEGIEWSLGDGCGWRQVRLAPDCHYSCGGHGNYVQVSPDTHEAWKADADLHLHVRGQGLGAVVFSCTLILDLRDMTGTVTTWPIGGSPIAADGFSQDFPAELKEQAAEKRDKIIAFLTEHMARRDDGKRKIETAHDRYTHGALPG